MYQVLAEITNYHGLSYFGPFTEREEAERCVVALSARPNVVSASLSEVQKEVTMRGHHDFGLPTKPVPPDIVVIREGDTKNRNVYRPTKQQGNESC